MIHCFTLYHLCLLLEYAHYIVYANAFAGVSKNLTRDLFLLSYQNNYRIFKHDNNADKNFKLSINKFYIIILIVQ